MKKKELRYLYVFGIIIVAFLWIDVKASTLSCTYDITYTGYSNKEEVVQLVITNDKENLKETWSLVNGNDSSIIDNINNKKNYTNKLDFDYFKEDDSFICPSISYTIVKDNNDGFRVYVGKKNDGYLNVLSASSNDSNNEVISNDNNNDNESNGDLVESTPTPSPTDDNNKIKWEGLGEDVDDDATCQEIMGDLIDELQRYFDMIRIIAPILLIIFGVMDFAGAVIDIKKDAMEKTVSKFIRRCIAAIAIFFLPVLIEVLLTLPGLPEVEDVLCGIR